MDVDSSSSDEDIIPQGMAIDANQVINNSGGYVWGVTDMVKLRRIMVLNTDASRIVAGQNTQLEGETSCLLSLIDKGQGIEAVEEITKFSDEGRTAKQDSIIHLIAQCCRQTKNVDVKKRAYQSLNKICRIPTHLFKFVSSCEVLSKNKEGVKSTGWGRAHRRGLKKWYTQYDNDPMRLARLVTKYKNRDGWAHKDVLRLCHVKTKTQALNYIFKYVTKGIEEAKKLKYEDVDPGLESVQNFFEILEEVKGLKDPNKTDHIEVLKERIETYQLNWEHLPTEMLKTKEIWAKLLPEMPMTAMLRNLNKMTAYGVLEPESEELQLVVRRLSADKDRLQKARIHPFNVLVTALTYAQGKGDKGSMTWTPIEEIKQALEDCFYLSFKAVVPTGKRYMLALDVSGSMTYGHVIGCNVIQPMMAAAAMAMTTYRTEENTILKAFSRKMVDLKISKDDKLNPLMEKMSSISFGSTDCAQPMINAMEEKLDIDVFIVYTDNDTWYGKMHPSEALRQYRIKMNKPDARLITCAMTATNFTIADPNDRGMLDMCGFDSSCPEIIRNFSLGYC